MNNCIKCQLHFLLLLLCGNFFAGGHRKNEETDSTGRAAGEEEDQIFVSPHGGFVRNGILERAPPSRPAPIWDKPLLKPYFDNSTSGTVISALGKMAYLHCSVKHLGDRVVTWIRQKDTHVLTVGLFTYTTDDRFTALHSEASDSWTLRIDSAQITDSGVYECQVSAEPKTSKYFILHVVETRGHIEGPSEIHMMSGSSINLTCSVAGSPEAPQYIYWYLGGTLINYSKRGGISVVTDKRSRTSRLLVTRAAPTDSGNYTCAPANAEPSSVSVYILNGEHPEAMQRGVATSRFEHCCAKLILILLLAPLWQQQTQINIDIRNFC